MTEKTEVLGDGGDQDIETQTSSQDEPDQAEQYETVPHSIPFGHSCNVTGPYHGGLFRKDSFLGGRTPIFSIGRRSIF